MKTTINTIALLILTLGLLSAQNFRVIPSSFIYLRPASQPIEARFNTYSFSFANQEMADKYGILDDEVVEKYFELPAYQYLPRNGDMEIRVFTSGGQYVGQKLEERTVTVTVKGQARKEKRYQYRVSYRLSMSYQILDGKRKVVKEGTIYKPGDLVYSVYGRNSRSKSTLSSNFRVEKNEFLYNSIQRSIRYGLQLSGDQIKDKYTGGYIYLKDGDLLSIKKGEKYGVGEFSESFETIKSMVENGDLKVSQKEALAKLQPILGKWKSLQTKFDPNIKKQRTQYFAITYSLARVYAYLGEMESAQKFAAQAEQSAFNFRSKDHLGRLLPFIEDMKARLLANLDVPETYASTFNATEAAKKEAELTRSAELKSNESQYGKAGIVFFSKTDSVEGYIKKIYTKGEILMRLKVYDLKSKEQLIDTEIEKVKVVKMDGKVYIPTGFSLPEIPIPTIELLEVMKFSKKLVLLKHDDNGYEDFLLMFPGRDKKSVVNLGAPRFRINFSKALSKHFEDCNAVYSDIQNNKYQLKEASLKQLIEDYKSCSSK
ncbi:MAG: hypothetical protein MRZ79_05755 [Bacteroidia bacterium]|nr:hypothetical protein [Bacteroidia bacterium]